MGLDQKEGIGPCMGQGSKHELPFPILHLADGVCCVWLQPMSGWMGNSILDNFRNRNGQEGRAKSILNKRKMMITYKIVNRMKIISGVNTLFFVLRSEYLLRIAIGFEGDEEGWYIGIDNQVLDSRPSWDVGGSWEWR